MIERGVTDASASTIWRWLADDALKPWQQRSWVFPRGARPAERGRALLAALAMTTDVGAGPEVDVANSEPGQLRDPKPRLRRDQQECPVAPPGAGRSVGRGQQSIDLGLLKEADERIRCSLRRDCERPRDRLGVLGMAQLGEPKQRADRRQPRVSRRHRVSALALEVIEEGADQRGVEVGDLELRRRAAGPPLGELHQQPDRVAVGGDRLRARRTLVDQPLGEERLQGRGERAHERPPIGGSRRSAASPSNSGEADRYQYVSAGLECPR